MRTSRLPVLATILAGALIACKSDSAIAPEPCLNCTGPDVKALAGQGVVLVNRTDHDVSITLRDLPGLFVDRKVVDGSIVVPIAPARRGTDRSHPLPPGSHTFLGSGITVGHPSESAPQTGGVVRIGSEPFFLAIGKGILTIRTREGRDVLEVEDPRAIVLLPVERDFTPCADDAFGEMLEEPIPLPFSGEPLDVAGVTRDDEGCRLFTFEGSVNEYRVCLPDALFPFAEGEALAVRPEAPGVRFENGAGVALELRPAQFFGRTPTAVFDFRIAFTENATCASIDATCGGVALPAKVLVTFDDETSQTLALGDSVVDPRDPTRTFFVLGARTRPVVDLGCAADGSGKATTPTRVVLALVERPGP